MFNELEVTDIVYDKVKEDIILSNNQTILSVLLSPSIKIKKIDTKETRIFITKNIK